MTKMIEIMIPILKKDGKYWTVRKIDYFRDSIKNLEFCDGSVKNILFDIKEGEVDYKTIEKLFYKFEWIETLIVKKSNDLIGVYKR